MVVADVTMKGRFHRPNNDIIKNNTVVIVIF